MPSLTAKRADIWQESASKRVKLDTTATTALETREVVEETSLEVDIMVLDYLAYQATTACLASRIPSKQQPTHPLSLHHNLTLTNNLLSHVRARHPTYTFDPDLRFRLMLLQFTTLFTQRLTSNRSTPSQTTLEQLRLANQTRARAWIGTVDRIPSSTHSTTLYDISTSFPTTDDLDRNRAHVLHSLSLPAEGETYEDAHYGTEASLSLLDILPSFMRTSAARCAMSESFLTEISMQMLAEFCLQASLEQYLVFGAEGTDAVDEAFAWGYQESSPSGGDDGSAEEEEHEDEIIDMFTDGRYETEVEGWAEIKTAHISQLFPSNITSAAPRNAFTGAGSSAELTTILETAATKYPITDFETNILSYLEAMAQSIPEPVLVQLERGQLDGMSKAETQEFIQSCGLAVSMLYVPAV
ncbi:hypothetical protein LTR78_002800 [Recurvomyces mirabilis]|uniref:Uncharacterized protein n=1 Tax=Recurvomyces mirabilis TaxID=574656 RepID=A0AAE0WSZ5_9PEZI|nr:hypothetical protein LTR78_002800 [Recurvomyces mirabilis]KAK5159466.1 hypothetical protein LTS14_002608 [Recurvomyces mirabilis]